MTITSRVPGSGSRLRACAVLVGVLVYLSPCVQLFSWHGAYTSVVSPQGRSSVGRSRLGQEPAWYPSTFWWRKRRQYPSSEDVEADFLGPTSPRLTSSRWTGNSEASGYDLASPSWSVEESSELSNHLANVPAHPVRYPPASWRFLLPSSTRFQVKPLFTTYPSQVSVHYASPPTVPVDEVRRTHRRKMSKGRNPSAYDKERELLNNFFDGSFPELQKSDLDVTPALHTESGLPTGGQGRSAASPTDLVKSSSKKTFEQPTIPNAAFEFFSDVQPLEQEWGSFVGSPDHDLLGPKMPSEMSRLAPELRTLAERDIGATFVNNKYPKEMKAKSLPDEQASSEPSGGFPSDDVSIKRDLGWISCRGSKL